MHVRFDLFRFVTRVFAGPESFHQRELHRGRFRREGHATERRTRKVIKVIDIRNKVI